MKRKFLLLLPFLGAVLLLPEIKATTPFPSMTCTGEITINLQSTGDTFSIDPFFLLEGGPYGDPSDYELTLLDQNMNVIPGNTITQIYVGQTLTGIVTEISTSDDCWSELTITQSDAPVILSDCTAQSFCNTDPTCSPLPIELSIEAADDSTASSELIFSYQIDENYDPNEPGSPTFDYTSSNNPYASTGNEANEANGSYPNGIYFMEWTVTDSDGNASSCAYEVEVKDCLPPVAVCDQITSVALDANGSATIFSEDIDDGSWDNCGLAALKIKRGDAPASSPFSDSVSFDCSGLGENLFVRLRVYDAIGTFEEDDPEAQYTECFSDITIEDLLSPIIVCPSDQTLNCSDFAPLSIEGVSQDTAAGSPVFLLPDNQLIGYADFVFDNCPDVIITLNQTDNTDACGIGTIERVFSAIDQAGNSAVCTQTLTLENQTPFDICDTDPWNSPVTGCAGGHSLDDGVEWPADMVVNGCGYLPDELEMNPAVDSNNVRPRIFSEECALTAITYTDQIIILGGDTILVVRDWTVSDWCQEDPGNPGGIKSWSYTQEITYIDTDCAVQVCVTNLLGEPLCNVELAPGIFTDEAGCALLPAGLTELTPTKEEAHINGVNILDMFKIRQYVLGMIALGPLQKIAADVSNEGIVSTFDLVLINQLLLGDLDFFPVPGAWNFEPGFIDLSNVVPGETIHIQAVKMGDVDGSADTGCVPGGSGIAIDHLVSLLAKDQLINAGETYDISIRASNFSDVLGFQLYMDYDTSVLNFVEFSGSLIPGFDENDLAKEADGRLAGVWLSLSPTEGVTLSEDDLFLQLRFTALKDGIFSESLTLGPKELALGIDENEEVIGFDTLLWENPIVTDIHSASGPAESLSVFPNPSRGDLHFQLESGVAPGGRLYLFNAYGQIAYEASIQKSHIIPAGTLSAGCYYYQIEVDGRHLKGKLILLE
jgi:hypothetical protein